MMKENNQESSIEEEKDLKVKENKEEEGIIPPVRRITEEVEEENIQMKDNIEIDRKIPEGDSQVQKHLKEVRMIEESE